MERLTRQDLKTLSDREVKIAHHRIKRDFSLGLLNDRVTPVENAMLLEAELRRRGGHPDDRRS
jgi:hypothetical protein